MKFGCSLPLQQRLVVPLAVNAETAFERLGSKTERNLEKPWDIGSSLVSQVLPPFCFSFRKSFADKCDPTMRNLLEEEHKQHGDIVFIRGHDSYNTLVNKTEGMLKYMFSLPENYTHVIKTDDDVYIRVRKLIQAVSGPKQMTKLYKGYMENPIGYQPFRDPKSKWFQNPETFTDEAAKSIKGTRYLVGWGYVLSRDVAFHAMKKVYKWHNHPETMPIWYERWLGSLEDVMTGILISDYVVPETDWRFRPSWRKCSRDTIVRFVPKSAFKKDICLVEAS